MKSNLKICLASKIMEELFYKELAYGNFDIDEAKAKNVTEVEDEGKQTNNQKQYSKQTNNNHFDQKVNVMQKQGQAAEAENDLFSKNKVDVDL